MTESRYFGNIQLSLLLLFLLIGIKKNIELPIHPSLSVVLLTIMTLNHYKPGVLDIKSSVEEWRRLVTTLESTEGTEADYLQRGDSGTEADYLQRGDSGTEADYLQRGDSEFSTSSKRSRERGKRCCDKVRLHSSGDDNDDDRDDDNDDDNRQTSRRSFIQIYSEFMKF